MKRDMDIIRKVLLQMEQDEEATKFEGIDERAVRYNLALMVEAELLHGQVVVDNKGDLAAVIVMRMTWKGHDFLDASRDSMIWSMAKKRVLAAGASWTFGVLLDYLRAEAKRNLGIA